LLASNVAIGGGEIDLIARVGRERSAIEVRSIRQLTADVFAIDAFDSAKAAQVRRLATMARCSRVDVIIVRFYENGVDLHWVPRAE
jgi:Holliday junction resolvase-like predicted endonuclease